MIRWTPDKRDLLRKLWADGYLIKTICREIGCGPTSLKEQCRKLGLPKRLCRGAVKRDFIKVSTTPTMYEALKRSAFQRNLSIAGYLRFLIRRDAGSFGGNLVVSQGSEQRVVSGAVR